jgi:hypothetical protein
MKSPLCRPALVGVYLCASCYFALSVYSAWGGTPPAGTPSDGGTVQGSEGTNIAIPGPLRSFMRMAAISQKASADEITPLLARNVFLLGYEGPQLKGRPTEFLVLLTRYVEQARELAALAGSEGVIRVSNCDQAKALLQILGYRTRPECGQKTTFLDAQDPQKAFLTIDSGFPLSDLERALQGGGETFTYPFPATRVPALFTEADWMGASRERGKDARDLLETLLHDPGLARLYTAVARMDAETQAAMRQSIGLKKLLPYAPVLDFYGSYIRVRGGRVVVPGGQRAEASWKELVGASPDAPADFVTRLLAKDRGWLAAYFDSLSRVGETQQAHFTEPHQLRRYYEALRGKDPSPDATRGVFRPDAGLLLLLTRVQWEANGEPHVPGNLDVWKRILRQKTDAAVKDTSRRARRSDNAGQLLEALFALSRMQTEGGPLQAYLMLSELDSKRGPGHALRPETVAVMASKFADFSRQYLIFSEFPALDDNSIVMFLNTAEALGKIPNHTLRGNAMGTFQANVGVWQILARQGQIPSGRLNESWQAVIRPFAKTATPAQLFDAGRSSLGEVLRAATGKPNASQDEIIDLLAGPHQASAEGQKMHREVANRIRAVMDGQRLVSLDTLLALGEGLTEMAKAAPGTGASERLVSLAGELREFEMPRPIFTGSERTRWAAGTYNNRHTELQMRTDLTKIIKSPKTPDQLAEARGELVPFMRDTLVGLNYAYYEPPGAQVLHNNPLFVRSHDFSGDTVIGVERLWQAPQLFGAGSPAGGGAHLIGSLADLPYALAEVEQDFIAPENVQALIWKELVPGLLTNATLPRWWRVSPTELHAISLYQQAGEELLKASAEKEELRGKVMNILSDRMIPQRSAWVEQAVREKRLEEAIPRMMPADTFYLTVEFRRRYPGENEAWGTAGQELENMFREHPAELSWQRLSQDFGVPHPILAQSYARELLNVKPFPAFEGYSSRLLAESWDSSNLYWARLADEMGYSPVALNRLVPELTRRMVEKIFATECEDWQAILRAMREAGEEFRQGKIALLPTNSATARP